MTGARDETHMLCLDPVPLETVEDLHTRFIVAKPAPESREATQTDNGHARDCCGSPAVLIEVLRECEVAAGQFEVAFEHMIEECDADTGDLSHAASLDF